MWTGSIALPRKIISCQDKDGFLKEEVKWEGGIQASYTDVTRNFRITARVYGRSEYRDYGMQLSGRNISER